MEPHRVPSAELRSSMTPIAFSSKKVLRPPASMTTDNSKNPCDVTKRRGCVGLYRVWKNRCHVSSFGCTSKTETYLLKSYLWPFLLYASEAVRSSNSNMQSLDNYCINRAIFKIFGHNSNDRIRATRHYVYLPSVKVLTESIRLKFVSRLLDHKLVACLFLTNTVYWVLCVCNVYFYCLFALVYLFPLSIVCIAILCLLCCMFMRNKLYTRAHHTDEIPERDVTYHLTCLLIYHGTTTHLYSCFIFFLSK